MLSNGAFLGPAELRALREVPELVFLNGCCRNPANDNPLVNRYNRAQFAADIATKLITIGVRVVVVAGWMVEDVAAPCSSGPCTTPVCWRACAWRTRSPRPGTWPTVGRRDVGSVPVLRRRRLDPEARLAQ